jgi:large subunit ribosomal protein L29
MKADDFRSLSTPELTARIVDMKKELFNLRMQLHSNQLTNSNKIRDTRRDIARAETVLNEKAN